MDSSSTTQEETPWYLKPAERPKYRKTFSIFKEHYDGILTNKFKENQSGFVRYLMDCYTHIRIPTDSGYNAWKKNGEKFFEISK
jgi:hypothetical protein